MANMPHGEMHRMEQDAIRRAREMQEKARKNSVRNDEEKNTGGRQTTAPPGPSGIFGGGSLLSGRFNILERLNLKSFLKDSDTSLLLAMLLLLSNEDADPMLIMALTYIML